MPKKSATPIPEAQFSAKVSPRGVARLKGGHAWVYRSDIAANEAVPPGALVGVTDPRGQFLGTALYSSSSQIAIRMISRERVADLPALVAERIRAAISYRERVVANSNAYRVAFSEADFLPGLIIDRYHDVISAQILTQAMDADPVRSAVVKTLAEELTPAGIVERVDSRIRDLEQLPPRKSGQFHLSLCHSWPTPHVFRAPGGGVKVVSFLSSISPIREAKVVIGALASALDRLTSG